MCEHGTDQGHEGIKIFLTANRLQVVKEERSDIRKTRDDVNEAKLETIVNTLDTFDHHLSLCTKQIGYWMTVQGSTLTVKVLLVIYFCDFCVHATMSPHLNFKINVMVSLSLFTYVTDLSADREIS